MTEPSGPDGPPVDVVRIMKEIRESIQKKREEGLYTDEEVESLAGMRLRAYGEEARIDGKLLERLLGPTHDWNISVDYLIRTTRPGLAGRARLLHPRGCGRGAGDAGQGRSGAPGVGGHQRRRRPRPADLLPLVHRPKTRVSPLTL